MAVMSAYEELLTFLAGRARGRERATDVPGRVSGGMVDEVHATIARKTYREKISWAHMIQNYRRVYSFHIVALHAMIVIAASEGVWHWRYLSTVTLTHAVFSVLMAAVALWAGNTGWLAQMRELVPWCAAAPQALTKAMISSISVTQALPGSLLTFCSSHTCFPLPARLVCVCVNMLVRFQPVAPLPDRALHSRVLHVRTVHAMARGRWPHCATGQQRVL